VYVAHHYSVRARVDDWAGPLETIQYDSARGFLSDAFTQIWAQMDIKGDPIPAEAHWLQGPVEKRIDTWKDVYTRVAQQTSISAEDSPWVYSAMFNYAINSWIRKSGFSLFQSVL
jgi:hypothetical protein